MSAVTKVSSTSYDFKCVTSMLNILDMIILAVKLPENIIARLFTGCYNFFICMPDSDPVKVLGNYKNVPDMTTFELHSFAFIDQGTWSHSDIHIIKPELKKGKLYFNETDSFLTDKNCCGITFTDNHFFLTYSGTYGNCGYVKMLDVSGTEKKTFSTDPYNGLHLFGRTLSKISVASDFKMYVSDTAKNQLSVVHVTAIDSTPSLEAEYDNMAANSIIVKGKNELIIAIGGQKNEVILLSTEGPKKVIRNYDIQGTPTALCLFGEILYVATSEGWLTKRAHIFGYKDNENKRKEERLISM